MIAYPPPMARTAATRAACLLALALPWLPPDACAVPSLQPLDWPPPMRVGQQRALGPAPQGGLAPLAGWCDFGAHAARLQPLPVDSDPVFRPLSPATAAAWRALRVRLDQIAQIAAPSGTGQEGRAEPPTARPAAGAPGPNREVARAGGQPDAAGWEAALRALIAGAEGPSIARLALQHRAAAVRQVAAEATEAIVGRHPRLSSFAMGTLSSGPPALAIASMRVLLAAGCDTPALYAMDALSHPERQVREAAIEAAFRVSERRADSGLLAQVFEHALTEESDVRLRALVARGIGEVGWLPGTATLERLLEDPDPAVRGEAMVAHAAVAHATDRTRIARALADKRPIIRAAAVRAAALAFAMMPEQGRALLSPLLGQRAAVRDPLGVSPPTTIGALARRALDYQNLASRRAPR